MIHRHHIIPRHDAETHKIGSKNSFFGKSHTIEAKIKISESKRLREQRREQ